MTDHKHPRSVDDGPRYVATEAETFFDQYGAEVGVGSFDRERADKVAEEIMRTGSYRHTSDELSFGAKIAWRNTARCIGKFYWKGLTVSDMRDVDGLDDIADVLVAHLRTATNGGRIRLLMTVLRPSEPGRPGPRIWNSQLVRYAGYRQADGTVVGDPDTVDFTDTVLKLGWRNAKGTPFDVLPLVLQEAGQEPRLYDLPADAALEVPLSHPDLPWFADLGLRWYAFPSISNQRLEIGGLSYPAAPFSAWYTAAEVGARNLADTNRYDMVPTVAEKMGLDTSHDHNLWKDRAMVEITTAVQHSFTAVGVTMIDHHFAAHRFVQHEKREAACGRSTHARWELLIPPISPAATPLWGRSYDPTEILPNFFTNPVWSAHDEMVVDGTECPTELSRSA